MVLISGVWPPAVTSSSLSPSRRLGKHYTHPTAKATRPKPRETSTETLGLPRFLGPPRRSTETARIRTSFMDRVTVRHVALGRRPPAPRTRCPPPAQPHPGLPARRQPAPAAMDHSLRKPQPPQTTTPQNVRNVATVKFLTEAPRAALPGLPRHRQPKALPRAGQAGREGRRASRMGVAAGSGASVGTPAAPGRSWAPGPAAGAVAGCWRGGRHVRRAATFGQPRFLNSSGPGVCAGALGAGVGGGVLNAGEPRPCGWGSRPFL
ncbi:hypothetical protein ABIE00_004985 [Arthrobacter sp. OAP107]